MLKTEVDFGALGQMGLIKHFEGGLLWNEFGFVVQSHVAKQSVDTLLLNI